MRPHRGAGTCPRSGGLVIERVIVARAGVSGALRAPIASRRGNHVSLEKLMGTAQKLNVSLEALAALGAKLRCRTFYCLAHSAELGIQLMLNNTACFRIQLHIVHYDIRSAAAFKRANIRCRFLVDAAERHS